MFSRSLTTSPARSSTVSDMSDSQRRSSSSLLQVSHPGSTEASRSPSPPPAPSQDSGSFDVTLLMPHKYGGVTEFPTNASNFDHFTEGARKERNFFDEMDVEDYDEDKDLDSVGMSNKSNNSSGNNSSMGRKTPDDGKSPRNSNAGLLDLLNLRLPKGRSQSRLSTVIQVRPYEHGDTQDDQEMDDDDISEASVNQANTRQVMRSKSFSMLSPSTPAHQVTPQSSSLSPTPQPGMYSRLSPTPTKTAQFIPRKLSSSSFFSPSPSETRRSRVTL